MESHRAGFPSLVCCDERREDRFTFRRRGRSHPRPVLSEPDGEERPPPLSLLLLEIFSGFPHSHRSDDGINNMFVRGSCLRPMLLGCVRSWQNISICGFRSIAPVTRTPRILQRCLIAIRSSTVAECLMRRQAKRALPRGTRKGRAEFRRVGFTVSYSTQWFRRWRAQCTSSGARSDFWAHTK
jgi:hypothetical protein